MNIQYSNRSVCTPRHLHLLFLGVWLKIAHEQFYGASTDVSNLIEANIAVNAHLWGALGGLLFSIIYLYMLHIKLGFVNKP